MNQLQERQLPPPLRVLPDMRPRWTDLDEDFDTAAQRLVVAHADDGDARDLPIPDLRTWGVVPDDNYFALAPLGGHHQPMRLRATGLSGLLGRLGAPVEFVRDRLTAPLQLATINYLLSRDESALSGLLRLRRGQVSAVVSERYAPFDVEQLVDTVRLALAHHGALGEVRVRAVASGMTDVLRLTFPSEAVAVKPGDISHVGLDISSSSFGRSAVHIRSMIWRLVCTNGLRMPEKSGRFSFRHVGESERLRDGIREAIPSALAHARGTMGRWRRAVTVMVDRVAELVDDMRELTGLERGRVRDELRLAHGAAELPERTDAYNLVNALTAAAHDAEPARRLELETFAGRVLRQQVGA